MCWFGFHFSEKLPRKYKNVLYSVSALRVISWYDYLSLHSVAIVVFSLMVLSWGVLSTDDEIRKKKSCVKKKRPQCACLITTEHCFRFHWWEFTFPLLHSSVWMVSVQFASTSSPTESTKGSRLWVYLFNGTDRKKWATILLIPRAGFVFKWLITVWFEPLNWVFRWFSFSYVLICF